MTLSETQRVVVGDAVEGVRDRSRSGRSTVGVDVSHEVRQTVLRIDRRYGNIERVGVSHHAVLTEDGGGQPIPDAGVPQPTTRSSLGQCDEDLSLHVGAEYVVISQLHTNGDILVDLSHQACAKAGHAAATLTVPDEVVSTEIAVHAIATEQRHWSAHFGIEAREGLFGDSRAIEEQTIPKELRVRRIQRRTEHVIAFANRHVAVRPEIDEPPERLEAQSNLVVAACMAGIKVVPARHADDAIEVFHPPAPTGTDVSSALAIVSHQPTGITE